jgi:ribosomal protein S20
MAKNQKKLQAKITALEKQIANIESAAEKKVDAAQTELDELYGQLEKLEDKEVAKRKAARADVMKLAARVLRKLDDKDATALAKAIEILT